MRKDGVQVYDVERFVIEWKPVSGRFEFAIRIVITMPEVGVFENEIRIL